MDEVGGIWGIATGLAAVIVAPLLAFWAARRTSSGRIATSDATDLWNEGQKIRDFLNKQVSDLRADLDRAKAESAAEIDRLEAALLEKDREIIRLETIIKERDARIERLEALIRPPAV